MDNTESYTVQIFLALQSELKQYGHRLDVGDDAIGFIVKAEGFECKLMTLSAVQGYSLALRHVNKVITHAVLSAARETEFDDAAEVDDGCDSKVTEEKYEEAFISSYYLLHAQPHMSVDAFLAALTVLMQWNYVYSTVTLRTMLSGKVITVVEGQIDLCGRGVELGLMAYDTFQRRGGQ